MGILDGIVEWIAEQVMNGLNLINTSVLGALGCNMNTFERYFPAAKTMYSIFVALAIGLILLNWIWQLFKNYGLSAGIEAEDPVKLSIRSVIFILLAYFADEIVNMILKIGGTPYNWILNSELPSLDFANFNSVILTILGVCASGTVSLIALILILILAWNYIKLLFEACVGGNKPHEFEGVVAVDKKVVLFGGEKNVNVFKSDCEDLEFCTSKEVNSCASRMPKAVVEATDPIVLDVKVFEKGSMPACSCCCCCDIPEKVMSQLEVPITDIGNDCERYLTVSLGIFSVIRLTRSAQLLVNATEYCVPDKECVTPCEENPCAIFNNMVFPTGEFCSQIPKEITSCSLKCK